MSFNLTALESNRIGIKWIPRLRFHMYHLWPYQSWQWPIVACWQGCPGNWTLYPKNRFCGENSYFARPIYPLKVGLILNDLYDTICMIHIQFSDFHCLLPCKLFISSSWKALSKEYSIFKYSKLLVQSIQTESRTSCISSNYYSNSW